MRWVSHTGHCALEYFTKDHVKGVPVINKTKIYVLSMLSGFLYNHFEIQNLVSCQSSGSKACLYFINFIILVFSLPAMIVLIMRLYLESLNIVKTPFIPLNKHAHSRHQETLCACLTDTDRWYTDLHHTVEWLR